MKKILSVALITSMGFAAGNTLMPYGAYIDYSKDSAKDYGYVIGAYYSKFSSPFKFEFDAEHTYITYKNKYIKDYYQYDFTAIVNYYKGYNWAFKIGNHSIFIDQDGNNNKYDNVAIAGIKYYKYLKYNTGLDFYYSSYDRFNVKQISPYYGFNFGNYYSPKGSFYLKLAINYIKLSDEKITGDDTYLNYDIALSNYIKNWTTTLKASFAKSAYKVENGGYVVYNLGEEYKNSFSLDIKYTWKKVNTFGLKYTYSKFNDNYTTANSSVYLISYSRAF